MECTDEVAINSVIEEAEQAGIVVVTTNQNCSCIHSAYLNNNSYDAGWLVGETLVKDMGETGKVVLLDCPASMTMSTLHGTGFQDYISQYPGIELVDYANIDGFSQENAATAMRDILTKHDEIDAVYGMSDDIAIGAIQAIESAGRTGDGILVYGSECMPNAVEALRNGTLKATVWGDRYTMLYMAFNIGLLYVDAGINSVILGFEDTPWISTPFKAVTQENVERMIPFLRYSSLQG
jgi:ribose transport system substrate-binding protein